MSYTPKPGSNTYRVLRHIEHVGGWVRSEDIARLIGIAGAGVVPYLQLPLKHGFIVRRRAHAPGIGYRVNEWALGPKRLPPADPKEPAPAERTMPSRRVPRSVFDLARTL